MAHTFVVNPDMPLYISDLLSLRDQKFTLKLSDVARERIVRCRAYLDEKMARSNQPVYGINTGFGSLYNVSISTSDLSQLQENLVMSHACGTGAEVPEEVVRWMMVLKVQSLSYGHSGVQLQTVERLVDFFNADCLPVVYTLGSLGASGDLAPLAHLSLPLIGHGEVIFKGKRMAAKDALKKLGWEPIALQSKEGLALLNGTQFMSAYGVYNLCEGFRLAWFADFIGALSLEAFDGRPEPFEDLLHRVRPHRGQRQSAANIREALEGSQRILRPKQHVQDPYSFRCMPQVHGATRDVLHFCLQTLEREINAVTDNPIIFPDEDRIISGGHFHGQPLAIMADMLALALAELGSISERRTYQLISGLRNLPAFLVSNPGLNSGFMIPQYTAASVVSQNKQYCTPASADSIVSSNGQEDHVSMGANAATKAFEVVQNTYRILAIELMTASQALSFDSTPIGQAGADFIQLFRTVVPLVENDRVLHLDMHQAEDFLYLTDLDPELVLA
jgi:histidine ammonia-lyase